LNRGCPADEVDAVRHGGSRRQFTGHQKRTEKTGDLPDINQEVRYIQDRARARDSRVVTLGDLVLFSTTSGDGWLLDKAHSLALAIACSGDPLPASIDQSDAGYKVGWTGRYRIDGVVFIYVDESDGKFTPHTGYPVHQLTNRVKSQNVPLMAAEREAQDILRALRRQTGRE
jgi:hypothetical protein